MPTNVTMEYSLAELEYQRAKTTSERLKALQKMLSLAPTHKGGEKLRQDIKTKISKLKEQLRKEAKQKKGASGISIPKEGAAQVVLVGTTNTGKSTLLKKLTGARVEIADYPFTTVKPEIGIMDYKGIKMQIVEMPAIVENFSETENGNAYLGIIRQADLMVLLFNNEEEYKLLQKELADIETKRIIYNPNNNIKEDVWRNIGLIKVYTKEPGKKPSYPPFALDKGSTIRDMAKHIHKDFIKKFRFARVWGRSAKFGGQQVGIEHELEDDDIVEVHLK
ncbi:TGS domain-containing protein [Candidatus Woesearchaeota archaeon]|nr:TGS domain-containing protein [Candidatus Woesearchaeota archaeon]